MERGVHHLQTSRKTPDFLKKWGCCVARKTKKFTPMGKIGFQEFGQTIPAGNT